MLTRRNLLRASSGLAGAAGLGLLGLPTRAFAAASGSQLKFLFVMNYGGWDPTRVFASEFANPNVDMERGADEATLGDLRFVDHAARPSVRTFFEKYAERSVIFNGLLVPSVAHDNCLRIALTGSTAQDRSDWGAIMAGSRSADFPIPQVVVGGPSYPGEFGAFVTRTGTSGQIEGLLSGDIAAWSDIPVGRPAARADDVMDAYLARRFSAAADFARPGREAALRQGLEVALDRSRYLKDLLNLVTWNTSSFAGQMRLATDLLALQVSRVATLSFSSGGWDTHAANDAGQSANFESLFSHLNDLVALLEEQPGESTATLADETVIVVLSEMGRTPLLNANQGKDHWPYTSALVMGPGLVGGRVIGGYDSYYYGRTVDPTSGDLHDGGTSLSSEVLGATLLTLAGVDPAEYTPGVSAVTAVIA
ncbi:MAG: DUF1501 domain-containing protein [Myxococcota bacterium]